MSDLIDRQAGLAMLDDVQAEVEDGDGYQYKKWSEYIEQLPAAQPQRNPGHWRVTPMACYGGGTVTEYECSECEEHQITVSNFCPNCGADMREGEQDE